MVDATSPNPALPVPVSIGRNMAMPPILEKAKAFMQQPAIAKALPVISLIGIVGLAAMIWSMVATPAQRPLFQGMSDTDKASVAQALDSAAIPYKLDRDTGGLSVSDEDFYRARMLMAQAGLPKAAPDGDAMVDSLQLGASRAVEGEKLRNAKQVDLARTIEAIDAVETARVHVALADRSVFVRDVSKPTASVMLRLAAGRTLTDSQVQAIIHLVASSVSGMSPDDVSVVDQAGRLLSGDDGDPIAKAANQQVQIQSKIESRYLESLNKLLIPMLGVENFTAEVHADLDFSEVHSTKESFPKESQVIRSEQGSWEAKGAGSAEAGGIPGALSNSAPPAAQVAAAPGGVITPNIAGAPGTTAAAESGKTSETYNRNYQLDHEVSVTKGQTGTVKRVSVAVAIRQGTKKLKPQEIEQLNQLIKGAVGFDQARGDIVALTQQQFAPLTADVPAAWYEADWLPGLARNVGAMLVALLLIFGVGRPLVKKFTTAAEKGNLAGTAGGTGLLTGGTNASFSGQNAISSDQRNALGKEIASELITHNKNQPDDGSITLDMIEATHGYEKRAELIRNFVQQDPTRAALVVRDLIRSDMPSKEAE